MSTNGPPDDATVPDNAILLRRIHPAFKISRPDREFSSAAFEDLEDEDGIEAMSINLEDRLLELGGVAVEALDGRLDHWLVSLTAGEVRSRGLGVVRSPVAGAGRLGASHGDVHGKKSRACKVYLAAACKVRVTPAG